MELPTVDSKVKQRIVGALVLLGLVAIIFPIIFHSGNMQEKNITLSPKAPPAPAKPQVDKIALKQQGLIVQKRQALVRTAAQRQPKIKMVQIAKQPLAVTAKKVVTAANNKALKTAAKKTGKLAAKVWGIQVASFKDKAYAHRLQERLRKKGYKAAVERVMHHKPRRYRVIVGPIMQKKEAEKLLAKLVNVVKSKGFLITYKPSEIA